MRQPRQMHCRTVDSRLCLQQHVQAIRRSKCAARRLKITSLFDNPSSTLDTILVSTVSLAIATEIGISALPLITGTAEAKVKKPSDEEDEEEEGIKWGVMTIVSCIPLLNWLVRTPAACCLPSSELSMRPLIVSAVRAPLHAVPSAKAGCTHCSAQAWVFAAFEDPQRAPIYYTNALIYAVPALSRGFNLDTFSVLCLLAGIAHVQVHGNSLL